MKIENKTNIGEILRNARKSKGIQSKQLAKEMGMSANAMCNIELSKNTPSWDALFSLCDKLDLQIEIKSKDKTTMKEEELIKGATVVHVKYNRRYTIDEPNAKLKDSEKGWIDCVIYRPLYDNPINAFAREKQSFLEEFELEK